MGGKTLLNSKIEGTIKREMANHKFQMSDNGEKPAQSPGL